MTSLSVSRNTDFSLSASLARGTGHRFLWPVSTALFAGASAVIFWPVGEGGPYHRSKPALTHAPPTHAPTPRAHLHRAIRRVRRLDRPHLRQPGPCGLGRHPHRRRLGPLERFLPRPLHLQLVLPAARRPSPGRAQTAIRNRLSPLRRPHLVPAHFSIFCIQALTVFMLLRLSTRAYPQDLGERWVLAAAVLACLFSGQQWFNFVMPFQVQFPMVYCAAIAAFFALWKAERNSWNGPSGRPDHCRRGRFHLFNGQRSSPLADVAPRRLLAAHAPALDDCCSGVSAQSCSAPRISTIFHRAIIPLHLPLSTRPQRLATFLFAQLGAPMASLAMLSEERRRSTDHRRHSRGSRGRDASRVVPDGLAATWPL